MPDTFALLLAAGIIGTSLALAGGILFDESRGRKRTIEHYRRLERERVLRVRRLHNQVGQLQQKPAAARGRWSRSFNQQDQRAA
jgi:hypothetical protein